MNEVLNTYSTYNNPNTDPVTILAMTIGIIILVLWSLVWKGLAMWKAARNNQRWWFSIMVPIQTIGILEIVYILYFQEDKNKEVDLEGDDDKVTGVRF